MRHWVACPKPPPGAIDPKPTDGRELDLPACVDARLLDSREAHREADVGGGGRGHLHHRTASTKCDHANGTTAQSIKAWGWRLRTGVVYHQGIQQTALDVSTLAVSALAANAIAVSALAVGASERDR